MERSFDNETRDRFLQTVEKTIEDKIVAQFFTQAEKEEMRLPYHLSRDYYDISLISSTEPAYDDFFGLKQPQLMLRDPRIAEERIAAVPQHLDVVFEGRGYRLPFRAAQECDDASSIWLQDRNTVYTSRSAIAQLTPKLSETFRLNSETEFFLGEGCTGNLTPQRPVLLVQLFAERALAKADEINAFIDQELQCLFPEQPFITLNV